MVCSSRLVVQWFGRQSNADVYFTRSTRSVPFLSPFRRMFRLSCCILYILIAFSVHNLPSRTDGVSWSLTAVVRLKTPSLLTSLLPSVLVRLKLVHLREASVSPNTTHCCASSKFDTPHCQHYAQLFSGMNFRGRVRLTLETRGCLLAWMLPPYSKSERRELPECGEFRRTLPMGEALSVAVVRFTRHVCYACCTLTNYSLEMNANVGL